MQVPFAATQVPSLEQINKDNVNAGSFGGVRIRESFPKHGLALIYPLLWAVPHLCVCQWPG